MAKGGLCERGLASSSITNASPSSAELIIIIITIAICHLPDRLVIDVFGAARTDIGGPPKSLSLNRAFDAVRVGGGGSS